MNVQYNRKTSTQAWEKKANVLAEKKVAYCLNRCGHKKNIVRIELKECHVTSDFAIPHALLSRVAHPLELIALYFIHIWCFALDRFWLATEFESFLCCALLVCVLIWVVTLLPSLHFLIQLFKSNFHISHYIMRYGFVSIIFFSCTRRRVFFRW